MVGVSSVGYCADPASPRRDKGLPVKEAQVQNRQRDAAALSDTAALMAKAAEREQPVKAERIEQIRSSLEQGTYRVQEVLLKVAARISNFVE